VVSLSNHDRNKRVFSTVFLAFAQPPA